MVQSLERETHDDIHIVAQHIHNFLVVMGVILCLLSLGYISLCTSLSIGNHLHIFENPHLHIRKAHDPFEVDYITHEKTSNKLFIHNNGKGIGTTFTLKESTNGSSS